METDYLLIAVDSQKKYAVRFLSLGHAVRESIRSKNISPTIATILAEHLLSSVLLGSRHDDQESTLFKIKLNDPILSLNCEVSPKGAFRSAIFPKEHKLLDLKGFFDGFLQVIRLNKKTETYQTVVEFGSHTLHQAFEEYLSKSVQTASVFLINADTKNHKKNYAIWIDKLPDTDTDEFEKFIADFKNEKRFEKAIGASNDPDKIVAALFDEPITILAVTKPVMECSCSKEKVMDALTVLPNEDLVDIFLKAQGITINCDYCEKEWFVSDEEIKKLMKASTMH